jgi:hypothetical protein
VLRNQLLALVTARYLASEEFNGLPGDFILCEFEEGEVLQVIETLVRENQISLNFGNFHPNPHIKALRARPAEEQIATLRKRSLGSACVYPERPHLETVVDQQTFNGRPYILALALGGAQLSHVAFDLSVLERYRNDPRYLFRNDDISGQISIRDGFFGAGGAAEGDQISMQTFGFCFDDDSNCYVAAFLRYLADLSSEHQQYWAGLEARADTKLHPDYFRPTLLGEFPENVSVYSAVLLEIQAVNDLSAAMGRAPFFRQDFREDGRPPHFGRILRPTAHELQEFVLTLDRMLSDNMKLDFYGTDVPREREIVRPDGRIEVQRKGSIQILSDWLRMHLSTARSKV